MIWWCSERGESADMAAVARSTTAALLRLLYAGSERESSESELGEGESESERVRERALGLRLFWHGVRPPRGACGLTRSATTAADLNQQGLIQA